MKQTSKRTDKWLTLRNFIGTQRLLVTAGCLLLALGIGAMILFAPAKDDKTVQKQQSPTLEQAKDELQQALPERSELHSTVTAEPEQVEDLAQAQTQTQTPQTETPAKPQGSAKQPTAALTRPADGEIITAFSGEQMVYNKTLHAWATHNGIDIAAQTGAPVRAALAGEVADVYTDPTMGQVVLLTHSGDKTTLYAGINDVCVQAGDKINAGQQLGKAGTPPFEQALGSHLHFEYRTAAGYADPVPLFGK